MLQRPLAPLAVFAALIIAILVAAVSLRSAPSARALPPAGSDTLGASGQVTVKSRLGEETIQLGGSVTIQRDDPHMDGDVEVADAEITAFDLSGSSLTGPVTIAENPVEPSAGEIRSMQADEQFPASSFFDTYMEVVIPGSGTRTPGSASIHNDEAMRLTADSPITDWPPTGVKYASAPLQGVDNDGDTLIDEDTADDDHDGLYDEDPPGNFDQDTDGQTDEDPSAAECPPASAGEVTLCDEDGDGQIDEDPDCVPFQPTLPGGVCVISVSITIGSEVTPPPTHTPGSPPPPPTRTPGPPPTPTHTPLPPGPEDPTFSVGPGGPSGFHPADLLGLSEASASPSGNDDFANATVVGSVPYSATQSTVGATLETGEPTNPSGCITVAPGTKGSTVWYRFTPAASGAVTVSTKGSNFDTVLAIYTGGAVNALTLVACEDDHNTGSNPGLHSEITFSATAGTTYRIQAGGYSGVSGVLHLSVVSGSGSGVSGGGGPPFVRITCHELGLSADGCDSGADGDQDDIVGLSFGNDFLEGESDIFFSVAPGSRGLTGTGVAAQAACSPAQPQADEFSSSGDGDNAIVFDGDGTGPSCPGGPPLYLTELPSSDNLDALNAQPPAFVDTDLDGTPDLPVFFTLAPGSPSLAAQGRTPHDILWTVGGAQPGVYAAGGTLGLVAGDAIDALCISDGGPGGAPSFNSQEDTVYFSLAPGSPSLPDIGASAADLLAPGPRVVVRAADLGLRQTDDVDAAKCAGEAGGQVGDVNCDGSVNAIDALLVLQLSAGLLGDLPCPENADVDGDGHTNAIDSALILQYVAGLLDTLPP